MALTDKQIKAVTGNGKNQRLSDGDRLFLRVNQKGTIKSWQFRYKRPFDNKEDTATLGHYPNMGLKEARKKALEYNHLLAQGIDPKQHEKKQREEALIRARSGGTFGEVANEWLERYQAKVSKARYRVVRGVFANHIFPLLENKRIDGEITSDLILFLMDSMAKKKLRTQQNNVLSLIEQVFNYAILTKRTRISPLDTATKLELKKELPKHITRHHPHVSIQEIPELLGAIEKAVTNPVKLIALKLMLLIHPRNNELRNCRWEYVDLEKGTLTLPSELMKGHRHKKEAGALEHVIYLPRQAIHLLEQLKAFTGANFHGWLFPNESGNKPIGLFSLNHELAKAIPPDRQDIHGVRGLVSTYLNEHYPEYSSVIEKMLGHKGTGDGVKLSYDHSRNKALKSMLWQKWADFLESQGMRI